MRGVLVFTAISSDGWFTRQLQQRISDDLSEIIHGMLHYR